MLLPGAASSLDRSQLITTSEASSLLGVSRQTLLNWVRQGKVAARRLGPSRRGRLLLNRRDVERIAAGDEGAGVPAGRRLLALRGCFEDAGLGPRDIDRLVAETYEARKASRLRRA